MDGARFHIHRPCGRGLRNERVDDAARVGLDLKDRVAEPERGRPPATEPATEPSSALAVTASGLALLGLGGAACVGIFRAFHQRAWRKLVVEDTARLCDGTSNGDDSRDGDVGVDDTRQLQRSRRCGWSTLRVV